MGLLSSIGLGIALFKGIITGIAGAKGDPTSGLAGKVSDTLTEVAKLVSIVEAVGAGLKNEGGLTGEQKLQGISGSVAQVVLQADFMIGNKIEDDALFQAGVTKITSGMADVLNSINKDGIKEVDPSDLD